MSELNAQQKKSRNKSRNSYDKQQQTEETKFLRKVFSEANEFSKKLAIIDTIIYAVSFIILVALMVLVPGINSIVVQIFPYITTIFITLRGSYAAKSAIENYKKISASVSTMDTSMNIDNENEEQG